MNILKKMMLSVLLASLVSTSCTVKPNLSHREKNVEILGTKGMLFCGAIALGFTSYFISIFGSVFLAASIASPIYCYREHQNLNNWLRTYDDTHQTMQYVTDNGEIPIAHAQREKANLKRQTAILSAKGIGFGIAFAALSAASLLLAQKLFALSISRETTLINSTRVKTRGIDKFFKSDFFIESDFFTDRTSYNRLHQKNKSV